MGPGTVRNSRARQVDHRIHRADHLLQAPHTQDLVATQTGHLFRITTPHGQAVTLGKPVSAKLAANQTSTAGQQNVHGIFLM